MQVIQTKLMNFYDAVVTDNGMEVQKILSENLLSHSKISVKMITGMLVIAIENRFINAGKAILNYNAHTKEKITDKHLNAIMCLIAKSHLLNQFKVTYH